MPAVWALPVQSSSLRKVAKVAIADFKVKEGEAVAKEINDNGGNAIFIGCDLSQKGAAAKVVKATLDAFGKSTCTCTGLLSLFPLLS